MDYRCSTLCTSLPSWHDKHVEYPEHTVCSSPSPDEVSKIKYINILPSYCWLQIVNFTDYDSFPNMSLFTIRFWWRQGTAALSSCPVHALTVRKRCQIGVSIGAHFKVFTPHTLLLKAIRTGGSITACRFTQRIRVHSWQKGCETSFMIVAD